MNIHQIVIEEKKNAKYPSSKPLYRPSIAYPEYMFKDDISTIQNDVYELVRNAFIRAGFDQNNIGNSSWNPLKDIVAPHDTVLLKPNFVMDSNPSGDGTDCLFTHPSVIAAIIDYVIIAFRGGNGRIIIGDAPMQECNFENLISNSGLDKLIEYYKEKGINIELVDFRGLKSKIVHGVYHSFIDEENKGIVVDLGDSSEFYDYSEEKLKRLRITNYNPKILYQHHNGKKQEYFISREILDADVIINIPKPKTHRKAGVTISLKNMVGINVRKEYLPHHTLGSKQNGDGDEYLHHNIFKRVYSYLKDLEWYYSANANYRCSYFLKVASYIVRKLIRFDLQDAYYEGSWYGNDTISKTIVDLNKILFFANSEGKLMETKQRKYLIVADMVVSGEGEGPIEPSKKDVGIIAVGINPVIFDEGIAKLMGVKPNNIPTISTAKKLRGRFMLSDTTLIPEYISNNDIWNAKTCQQIKPCETLMYVPSYGWRPIFFSTSEQEKLRD